MLVLKDVQSSYGGAEIVRGVSLSVEKDSVVALLGRNGMGKTTCIHTIMGLVPSFGGSIHFKNEDITKMQPHKISPLGLALVPQGRRIFPSLNVRENLVIGMRGTGYDLQRIYDLFPILDKRGNHKGDQLSGGEQQMLAIARAMVANPDLIIMDEPSEGLAPIVIESIGDIILKLKEDGMSILLVEQNMPLALKVSSYVNVMSKGRIVHQCTSSQLEENPLVQEEFIGVSKKVD